METFDTHWYTPIDLRYSFTRRPDGKVVVATKGVKNCIDIFTDNRDLDIIAKEWLEQWG